MQVEYEGESGVAPPAAEKANRFRGSGTISGPSGAGDRIAATVSGSPLVWNRMPATGCHSSPIAPRSGSFLDCEAGKKARHCEGCRKSAGAFFDSLRPLRQMPERPQPVEKSLFGEKAFSFAGGARGGGSPLVLNRMPAKSLRQQALAPRSGSFLDCEAGKKARHCAGCRKSPPDFFDSLKRGPANRASFCGLRSDYL